jgi:uncharacterized protein (TIGR00159 family)
VTSALKDVWERLGIADVFDVIIVAALVYAAISWLRRARSRFVALGFAALVVTYFLAQLLKMRLTLVLFQAGIAIALVALVVIFQEDLRRAFERIALSSPLAGRRPPPPSEQVIGAVIDSVDSMAERRIGALIVFRGKDPLERHMTGGFVLDGSVSEPLLLSIFDPTSPGHDGAVVIEGGAISRFAVHLPLSTEPAARHGTRHAAALGLSERCDALVVVVSEERGTISVARAGTLEPIESVVELKRRLSAFLHEVAPTSKEPTWRRLVSHNLGLKVLSLAVAVAAWLVLIGLPGEARSHDPGEEIELPVKVETQGQLPLGVRLESIAARPSRVRLVVRTGEEFEYRQVRTEPVDLSNVSRTKKLTRGLLPPEGTRFAGGQPTEVEVTIEVAAGDARPR